MRGRRPAGRGRCCGRATPHTHAACGVEQQAAHATAGARRACRIRNQPLPNQQLLLEEDLLPLLPAGAAAAAGGGAGALSLTQMQLLLEQHVRMREGAERREAERREKEEKRAAELRCGGLWRVVWCGVVHAQAANMTQLVQP
jgi:hypothetical protein